jgi:hypothetical protein
VEGRGGGDPRSRPAARAEGEATDPTPQALSRPRGSRALALLFPVFAFLCAALFMALYTARTRWISPGMDAFTHDAAPYPFRFRILIPGIARFLNETAHVPLGIAYAAIGTLAVFALLLVYERFLALWLERDFARVLAFGLLYPMAWNYLGLNLMYFPFDLPGLCFFTAGLLLLVRRQWLLYYPLFALATINRETTWFLTVVFLFTEWGRMRKGALLAHVLAQAVLWVAIKAALYQAFPGAERALFGSLWWKNQATLVGMFTLRDNGLKDWAKLFLMFGGFWMLVPFVWRGQPPFVRRALLAAPVLIAPMFLVGTIDEARQFPELIPLIATPVLLRLGAMLAR